MAGAGERASHIRAAGSVGAMFRPGSAGGQAATAAALAGSTEPQPHSVWRDLVLVYGVSALDVLLSLLVNVLVPVIASKRPLRTTESCCCMRAMRVSRTQDCSAECTWRWLGHAASTSTGTCFAPSSPHCWSFRLSPGRPGYCHRHCRQLLNGMDRPGQRGLLGRDQSDDVLQLLLSRHG
jgi:hypothetical protein